MSWLKAKISEILPVGFAKEHPYRLWHPRLLEDVPGSTLEGCFDQRLILLHLCCGSWERLERTAAIWGNADALSAVQISRELAQLYLCLLYPRETLLADLAGRLDCDSTEARLCRFYGLPDSDYRHIRNALAHGTFAHEGQSIEFVDREWSRRLRTEQLELDCFIILDLIFSAGERVNTVLFDAYGKKPNVGSPKN